MSQALNLSRQREQTLIFVSQEARQVDKNIASAASVVIFKELGMLRPEFERPELRKLVSAAGKAFNGILEDKRKWAYVYSPDAGFLGPLGSQLASFWKSSLSRLFAAEATPAQTRNAERTTPKEKAQKARDLRDQGLSYSQIAQRLGVSKATVANYLKGYPYRGRYLGRNLRSDSPGESPPQAACGLCGFALQPSPTRRGKTLQPPSGLPANRSTPPEPSTRTQPVFRGAYHRARR